MLWVLIGASLLGEEYVGSGRCAPCHRAISEHWKGSAMGRSMSSAGEHLGKVGGETRVGAEKLRREFSVRVEDGVMKQREAGEGFAHDQVVKWAIGSGVNGYSFVVQRGDHLFQAPLSYYARVGQWGLSPGYEFADYGFNRPIAAGCIHCHSGRPRTVAQTSGKYEDPPFAELAIGCESCHGPGQKHVAAGGAKGTIVNPKKLERERADEICMRCHQGGDARVLLPGKTEADYRPGQALAETVAIFRLPRQKDTDLLEHHESMRLSECYQKSGTMNCQSCHNPHEVKTDYRAKCLSCHEGKLGPKHVGAQSDCVSCHMPKREVGVIAHAALTNHRIPRRPEMKAALESGEELLGVNRTGKPWGTLIEMQAYGMVAEKGPQWMKKFEERLGKAAVENPEDGLVLATLGRRALREKNYGVAVEQLSRALERGWKVATTYEDLGEALARTGQNERAVGVLREGIAVAPFHAVLYKSLALRFIQMRQYGEAKETLEKYVGLFPEDDFVRRLLKQVSGG
jgi:hypothetical protein